jgi:hypothetical protein
VQACAKPAHDAGLRIFTAAAGMFGCAGTSNRHTMTAMMRVRALGAALPFALAACGARTPPRPAQEPAALAAAAPAKPPVVLLTAADVDARLRAEWQKAGVAPTAPANDATWLRRVWIDVVGTVPPPEVTLRFLAERTSPSGAGAAAKRARMIEDLLASPAWADHWTTYFDDLWMGRDAHEAEVDRGAFRSWLHDALSRNVPWNEVVSQLLTATGRNSGGGPRRASEQNDGTEPVPAGVNGAVNWTLKYTNNPQDMAGAASRTLLGVQIQCAQCHDHKTEKWTQHDFQGFAAAFVRTRLEQVDTGNPMGAVRRVNVVDLDRVAPRFPKMGDLGPILSAKPVALDGADLGEGAGVRAALARWVTSPDNPWFARAVVNRMWAHFLGRGFVDPVDDFRASNPPVAPELLDALSADFVRSGYDLKHLARVIAGTEAYALSAAALPEATAKVDPQALRWERFRVTPLGPVELLSAIVVATRLDAIVRSTGRLDLADVRYRMQQRYGFLFDVDEESGEGEYEGTIAQGLALLNGNVIATGASVLPGSALAEVLAMPGDSTQDAARIEALYVRVLSRLPTSDETARAIAFLAEAQRPPDPAAPPPPVATPAAPAATGAAKAAGAPTSAAAAPTSAAVAPMNAGAAPMNAAAVPMNAGAASKNAAVAPMNAAAAQKNAPAPPKNARPPAPDPLRGLADRAGNAPANARVRAWEDLLWTLLNSSEFVLNH